MFPSDYFSPQGIVRLILTYELECPFCILFYQRRIKKNMLLKNISEARFYDICVIHIVYVNSRVVRYT